MAPATTERLDAMSSNPPAPAPTGTEPATGSPAPATAPPTPAPPTPPAATPTEPTGTPEGEPLGEAGLKALAAERTARKALEDQVKALQPLADKAQALEDEQKTEQQKLTEALNAAKAESASSSTELMQLQAAMAKAPAGIEPGQLADLASRLRGTTREEMEADAETLFAQFSGTAAPAAPPTGPVTQTPVEALKPGAMPTPPPEAPLAERIAAAEAAGDMATAMSLKSQRLMELHQKQT